MFAALILMGLVVGCTARQGPAFPTTNLGGLVSVDGVPIPEGMIAFSSMDPKFGQADVTKVVRGRYIADNVPLGKILVIISAFQKVGPPGGGGGSSAAEVDLIPPHYRNGILIDVTPTTSRVDFALKAKPTPVPAAATGPGVGESATRPEPEPEPKPEPKPEPAETVGGPPAAGTTETTPMPDWD